MIWEKSLSESMGLIEAALFLSLGMQGDGDDPIRALGFLQGFCKRSVLRGGMLHGECHAFGQTRLGTQIAAVGVFEFLKQVIPRVGVIDGSVATVEHGAQGQAAAAALLRGVDQGQGASGAAMARLGELLQTICADGFAAKRSTYAAAAGQAGGFERGEQGGKHQLNILVSLGYE